MVEGCLPCLKHTNCNKGIRNITEKICLIVLKTTNEFEIYRLANKDNLSSYENNPKSTQKETPLTLLSLFV